jgi:hypothetical protein
MALKVTPAEGPPRTRTGRGIDRAGATPSSHICQARPSPLRRRRAWSSTPAATAHSSSTASRSATAPHVRSAAAGPGWAVPCPHHGWHQHQARQRPATVGTTLKPREDREHCDRRPGCIPPPPIRPPSMPRLIPAESAHAARSALPARQAGVMVASQDWPLPSTCHGFSACPGSPGGHLG